MAIRIGTKPNTETTDVSYPLGRFKDFTVGNPGTPIKNQTMGDVIQFFLRLLKQAGRGTGNNLQDNVVNGYELYESMGFWQDAGTGAGDLEFFDDGTLSNPAMVGTPTISHNRFMIQGNNLEMKIKFNGRAAASVSEIYIPIPPPILTLLGAGFIDISAFQSTGWVNNNGTEKTLYITPDVTVGDGVLKLEMFGGGTDFSTVDFTACFDISIPIISAL